MSRLNGTASRISQVPTWNYVAIHQRGALTVVPRHDLRTHLDDLSASFEKRMADEIPWTTAKMTPETPVKFMAMIVPITLSVARVDGARKYSQNEPEDVRLRAADGTRGAHVLRRLTPASAARSRAVYRLRISRACSTAVR